MLRVLNQTIQKKKVELSPEVILTAFLRCQSCSKVQSCSRWLRFSLLSFLRIPCLPPERLHSLTYTGLTWALILQCPCLLSLLQHESLCLGNLISCSQKTIKDWVQLLMFLSPIRWVLLCNESLFFSSHRSLWTEPSLERTKEKKNPGYRAGEMLSNYEHLFLTWLGSQQPHWASQLTACKSSSSECDALFWPPTVLHFHACEIK